MTAPMTAPIMHVVHTHCPACGARVPAGDGPAHPYYGAAPGCWALYGEVLAREYSDYRFARRHRLTADAYAAQHPGRSEDLRAVQSVAVHLVGLCLSLEPPAALSPGRELAPLLQAAAADRSAGYRRLPPPADLGAVTVADVHAAVQTDDRGEPNGAHAAAHLAAVERWAASVWAAWAAHHGEVRGWAARLLEGSPPGTRHRARR